MEQRQAFFSVALDSIRAIDVLYLDKPHARVRMLICKLISTIVSDAALMKRHLAMLLSKAALTAAARGGTRRLAAATAVVVVVAATATAVVVATAAENQKNQNDAAATVVVTEEIHTSTSFRLHYILLRKVRCVTKAQRIFCRCAYFL